MATIEAQNLQLFAVNRTASEENSTQGPQLSRTTIRATGRRRWGKHYGAQHILSRGCKQVELRQVRQQFCKHAILTISIIPRGFSIFFPSNTLIFLAFLVTVLKKFNIRTCEHMILGQLRIGARQAKNAPLAKCWLQKLKPGGRLC